jgi:hypothetical protein
MVGSYPVNRMATGVEGSLIARSRTGDWQSASHSGQDQLRPARHLVCKQQTHPVPERDGPFQ